MQRATRTPHLEQTASSKRLIVNGEPFLMLAGELQNSSFSSAEYMGEVWDGLQQSNYNTLLASVSWEQIEPAEGQFTFAELDKSILEARRRGLRLVLLWFGSFKNGLSTYAPSWVKVDPGRFPRAQLRSKSSSGALITGNVLSIFGTNSQTADARAFSALMRHIDTIDSQHSTVIMVQVENEVGLLGDSRDRGSLAEEAFHAPIPEQFTTFLAQDPSSFHERFAAKFSAFRSMKFEHRVRWSDLPFDELDRDELFMAFYYSLYVEKVASAGKAVYPLPMYTNVWQNYGDDDRDPNAPLVAAGGSVPGDYPSGGGVINVLDIWQRFAPSLDFIAPDIYLNDYPASCAKYRHHGQPLFIPEQRRDEYGARRMWVALGSYQCMGVAPFGVDSVKATDDAFRPHYGLLAKVSKLVLAAQAKCDSSVGFFFDEIDSDGKDPSSKIKASFGGWDLIIERSFVFGRPAAGSGMVLWLGDDSFLLVGWGFQVTFESSNPNAYFTGLLSFEEKTVDHNGLSTVRLLNGDETRSGQYAIMPSLDPDYGGFPISITIPARTGIALCRPYALLK